MIWAIGVVELKLPWTNYFDDYPILTPGGIALSTMSAAKCMLKLLGVGFAENKLEPFATQAEVLGVVVDCSRVGDGKLVYRLSLVIDCYFLFPKIPLINFPCLKNYPAAVLLSTPPPKAVSLTHTLCHACIRSAFGFYL